MTDFTFHCPKCGSSTFGSMTDKDPEAPMQRFCHGRVDRQDCRFSWWENEDWKYMTVNGQKVSEKEFSEAMAKVRATPAIGIGFPEHPFEPPSAI